MNQIKPVPRGFDAQTWERFTRDGFLLVKHALTQQEVGAITQGVDAIIAKSPGDQTIVEMNILEASASFDCLIDHPSHIGFIHDVYGDMSKILLTEAVVRPRTDLKRNKWHFDGPRILPFKDFSPQLPLRIKAAYWLTPLPNAGMGNMLVIPGSHRTPFLDEYHTHMSRDDEHCICAEPGDMLLMHEGLWHRVDQNHSEIVRKTIFLEYGPTWVPSSDRYLLPDTVMARLNREQRILVRNYAHPNHMIKPPEEDCPLYGYHDDHLAVRYTSVVPVSLRQKMTRVQREFLQPAYA
jgi:ectoine hydroxylase